MAVIEGFANVLRNLDISPLTDILLAVVPAILCFSIHELSHGCMACLLGDDTAKREGRLSLNPLRHIDPLGFLMLVVFRFGWAKPVQVDMRRFKNPRAGMALTAFAGPGANILLSLALMPVFGAFVALGQNLSDGVYEVIWQTIVNTIYLSLRLAVFNLVPIPPLDGSKIAEDVLPERAYYQILRYERYGMILLFAAVWSGVLSRPLAIAADWLLDRMLPIAVWTAEAVSKLI